MQEQEVNNTFEGEEVGQVKMSKVEKFFEKQKGKFNTHMEGIESFIGDKLGSFIQSHEAKIDNFIKAANEQIAKSDKKFSGMYNTLLREFLGKMEERIYMNELSSQTQLLVFSERLFKLQTELAEIKNKLDPELKLEVIPLELYMADLQKTYEDKMREVHTKSMAKANEGEPNVQVDQAPVEEAVQETPAAEA